MFSTAIQLHGHAIMVFIRRLTSWNVDARKLHDIGHESFLVETERALENIGAGIVRVHSYTVQMTHITTAIRLEQNIRVFKIFRTYRAR